MSNTPKQTNSIYDMSAIQKIDIALSGTEILFNELLKKICPDIESAIHFFETRTFKDFNLNSSNCAHMINIMPTKLIDNFYSDGTKSLEFQLEIQRKRVDGNLMYFDYVKDVFLKHYKFITKYFLPGIKSYFENKDELRIWINAPYDWLSISDIDFLHILCYRYLQIFEKLEGIIAENYSNYTPLLIWESKPLPEIKEDLFKTIYTEEKLQYIYEQLNDKYIRCSLQQFLGMFGYSKNPFKDKIQWINTEVNFVLFFCGQAIPKDSRFIVKNDNLFSLMANFFINKDGKPFNAKQLCIVSQKLGTTKNPRDSQDLVKLLIEINS
jgi:hypothetical protein